MPRASFSSGTASPARRLATNTPPRFPCNKKTHNHTALFSDARRRGEHGCSHTHTLRGTAKHPSELSAPTQRTNATATGAWSPGPHMRRCMSRHCSLSTCASSSRPRNCTTINNAAIRNLRRYYIACCTPLEWGSMHARCTHAHAPGTRTPGWQAPGRCPRGPCPRARGGTRPGWPAGAPRSPAPARACAAGAGLRQEGHPHPCEHTAMKQGQGGSQALS
jgi:hypothetical protein